MKQSTSPAKQRERAARVHRWVRYGVQLVFFIMAPALFSGAFNGVKYLFSQIGLGQAIEPTSFLVQLVAALVFTIVFGRFFCGYACAFGTLGDYLYNACEFVRRRTPLPRVRFPQGLVKALSLFKYVVLVAICVACFAGVWASYSSYSPWVAFAAILAGSIDGIGAVALAALGLVVVGMVVRERFFCQFLCPLGAVFSLMPVFGFSQYTRTRAHCAKRCGRCHGACPVDIWPDGDALEHGECISCGRCADVCPMANVNLVAFEKAEAKQARLAAEEERAGVDGAEEVDARAQGPKQAEDALDVRGAKRAGDASAARPVRKTREKWHLVRGTSVGSVVARAVLLLVVCWAVGAARYVPPFAEVFGFNPLSWFVG